MLYRRFGKTNENVSALGFGCMRLPLLPGGDMSMIDEKQAAGLIHRAIDEGVNYIDTAFPYHKAKGAIGGESEPFVGRALKGGYRQKVYLATKLPTWMVKTKEDLTSLLDEQLKRLDTDVIDFYLMHSLHKETWDTLKNVEFGEFLDKAVKDGKIRYAGFSFHDNAELFKNIVDYYDWSFCQIQYNYVDEYFQAGTEGLEYAAAKGLGMVIMEPLRGGKLAQGLPPEVSAIFEKSGIERTPAGWALRWIWNRPEVSTILSGMNSVEQLEDNLKTANEALPSSLSKSELEIMERAKAAYKGRISVSCTECGYCQPCPEGVDIPSCFTYYNNFSMFGREEGYNMWLTPEQKASSCKECGICEAKCPQGLPIREHLKEVRKAFGT